MRDRREIQNDIDQTEEAILSDLADHDDGDDSGLQSVMAEKLQKFRAELRAYGDSENIEGTGEGETCGREGSTGLSDGSS